MFVTVAYFAAMVAGVQLGGWIHPAVVLITAMLDGYAFGAFFNWLEVREKAKADYVPVAVLDGVENVDNAYSDEQDLALGPDEVEERYGDDDG